MGMGNLGVVKYNLKEKLYLMLGIIHLIKRKTIKLIL